MTRHRIFRIIRTLAVFSLCASNAPADGENTPEKEQPGESQESELLPTTVVPLGDVEPEANQSPKVQSNGAANPTTSRTDQGPDLDAKKSTPPTTRGTFAIGLQVAIPSQSLRAVTNDAGFGPFFNFGLAPAKWPVLLGLSFDLLDFGGPSYTFPLRGVVDSYKLRAQSHSGSLFVRLAPERGRLRPYFDVMGGYWAFFSEIKDSKSDSSEGDPHRLGSDVVGHYGLRAGLDILFVEQATMGIAGVGVSVQWMRGGTLRLPDTHNAEVIDGTLSLDRESRVQSPHQFLFMLSYVLSSNRGDF